MVINRNVCNIQWTRFGSLQLTDLVSLIQTITLTKRQQNNSHLYEYIYFKKIVVDNFYSENEAWTIFYSPSKQSIMALNSIYVMKNAQYFECHNEFYEPYRMDESKM